MIRHFCDVCGKEARLGTDVIVNVNEEDEYKVLPIEEQGGIYGLYRELCLECAKDIVDYIVGKSREHDNQCASD